MSDSEKKRKDALDEFWDIGRLVPPKLRSASKPILSPSRTTPAEVSVNFKEIPQVSKEEGKLTVSAPPSPQKQESVSPIYAEYENFSTLIPNVKILNWKSTYNYYEFFCRQAAALYPKHGCKCPEAHFFSYVAQYSQLNRRQLDWYLWWRECVRKEVYLSTDISYIYLLIFEIINLGSAIDTQKSLDILIALWSNYKDTYPQLTGALGDWICDYSLIHNLPIRFPDPRIGREMITSTSFAEAFFRFDLSDMDLLSKFLLSFCNAYNYKKSKFYTEDQQALYDEHLPRVVKYLLEKIDINAALAAQPRKCISRVAFTGALCSYKTRKHIEVELISLCDSHELRSRMGDIIKYAENKLRAYVGIRSRLGVPSLDEKTKAAVDEYFAHNLAMTRDGGAKIPEYEKLYETKETAFSLESALDIEKRSWAVTEKLVDAFEENIPTESTVEETPLPQEFIILPISEQEQDAFSEAEQFIKAISKHVEFFWLIFRENVEGQRSYISKHRIMAEAVVDEINEQAADILGDIVIEEAEEGYRIIDEYRSMFEQED